MSTKNALLIMVISIKQNSTAHREVRESINKGSNSWGEEALNALHT